MKHLSPGQRYEISAFKKAGLNQKEIADHLSICKKLNTVVYFTDPYSS